MDKAMISKFTLYDILSMVIPGGIIYTVYFLPKWNMPFSDKEILAWIVGLVVSYLIGLVNHILITTPIWSGLGRCTKKILSAKKKAKIQEGATEKSSKEKIVDEYFGAYYYAAKHRYSDDIFIMERQVAFMQNMIVPLLALVFTCPSVISKIISDNNICCFKIFVVALTICLFFAIFLRQKKIYRRVWEDNHYLRGSE